MFLRFSNSARENAQEKHFSSKVHIFNVPNLVKFLYVGDHICYELAFPIIKVSLNCGQNFISN